MANKLSYEKFIPGLLWHHFIDTGKGTEINDCPGMTEIFFTNVTQKKTVLISS